MSFDPTPPDSPDPTLAARAEAFLAIHDGASEDWDISRIPGARGAYIIVGDDPLAIVCAFSEFSASGKRIKNFVNSDANRAAILAARNDAPGIVRDLMARVREMEEALRRADWNLAEAQALVLNHEGAIERLTAEREIEANDTSPAPSAVREGGPRVIPANESAALAGAITLAANWRDGREHNGEVPE